MGETGKRYAAKQIVSKLSEAEVELARGLTIVAVAQSPGITDQTYSRWRREFGGLKVDQAELLKKLEQENARLKRVVADLTIDTDHALRERRRWRVPSYHRAEY